MFKNVNILEFGDYIWNHHEKCIEIKCEHAWYWFRIGTGVLRDLTRQNARPVFKKRENARIFKSKIAKMRFRYQQTVKVK